MKTALILTGCLLLGAATPTAAEPRSQIEEVFATHVAAIQTRDMASLEKTLTRSDNLILILPDGTLTRTRAEYVDFHNRFFAEPGWSISFEPVSMIIQNDSAIITTRSTYRDLVDGNAHESGNWVTFVFERDETGWKLVHDQNTRIPAE